MKMFFAVGYLVFALSYGLFVVALAYHEKEFTLTGDPIRAWSKTIQATMGVLLAASFVIFLKIIL